MAAIGDGHAVLWEWRHPQAGMLDRRARRFVVGAVVVVLALMVVAGLSQVGSGDAVGLLLSVLVGPGLVALLAVGLWAAMFRKPTRFRMWVTTDRVLHVDGHGSATVPLLRAQGIAARVATTTSQTSHGTTTHARVAALRITDAGGRHHTIALPGAGLGSRLLTADELAGLEQQLHAFT